MVTPNSHTSKKSGCPDCGTRRMKQKQSMGIEKFIQRAEQIHKGEYSYDRAVYKNKSTKLLIHCKSCQEYFSQSPNDHLYNRAGCPKCGNKRGSTKQTLSQEQFISKSKAIYGDAYGYDHTNYQTMHSKVELYCNTCQEYFSKLALNHIHNQQGCPTCSVRSKGELAIGRTLEAMSVPYERERVLTHEDRHLRADVYLPGLQAVIEFDGEQHFKPGSFFTQTLDKNKAMDRLKERCCIDHRYSLLRIHYRDLRNVSRIVTTFVKKLSLLPIGTFVLSFSRSPTAWL